MADDIMEISFEDRTHVDEDLDFDFELTAPAGDEDAILEDADITESGNGFLGQPSPGRGHDAVMDDEDQHDVFATEDHDLLHNGAEQSMEHETMSFTSVDVNHFNDNNTLITAYEDDSEMPSDNLDNGQQIDDDPKYGTAATANESVFEDRRSPEKESLLKIVDVANDDAVQNHIVLQSVQATDPVDVSGHAAIEKSQNPATSILENESVSDRALLDEIADHSQTNSPALSREEREAGEVEELLVVANDAADSTLQTNGVIVLYQSNEYALFSSSELDDPDSYFLSDRSIVQKPLAELLKAIRGIIHEDLGEEEELCISIRDLELNTEEVASALQHVTLAQILALHIRLLLNDGLEISPLHIELGVRKSFLRRLMNLTVGADSGKGITEFVAFSEESESAVDLGIGEVINNELEQAEYQQLSSPSSDGEGHTNHIGEEDPTQSIIHPASRETREQDTIGESNHKPEPGPESSKDTEVPTPITVSESGVRRLANSTVSATQEEDSVKTGEFDEDGDLIDYSEEELENAEKLNRQQEQSAVPTTEPSRTGDDNNANIPNGRADVDTSSSFKAEEKLQEQAEDPAVADTNANDIAGEDDLGEHEDFDQYEEEADINRDDEVPTTANEDPEVPEDNSEQQHDTDGFGVVDEHSGQHYQESSHELIGDGTGSTELSEHQTESDRHDQLAEAPEEESSDIETSIDDSWHAHDLTETVAVVEAEKSSGTVSPDEIGFEEGQEEVFPDPTSNDDHLTRQPTETEHDSDVEDEIDYEDEIGNGEPSPVSAEVRNAARPSDDTTPIKGKRSREDLEPDDVLESQDAKRSRS